MGCEGAHDSLNLYPPLHDQFQITPLIDRPNE